MSVSVSGNTNIVTVTQPTTQVVRVVTAGPRGPEGIQGVQGIQGLPGEGTQGVQGIAGSAGGEQGLQGIQGVQGEAGTQGAVGLQGIVGESIQGITGAQGAIGSQGSTGIQGSTGQGIQGTIGETGIQGIQGTAGEGIQGAIGEIGVQGTVGETGIQGPIGIQGIAGEAGIQGIAGLQGAEGIQGPQGIQGVGIQGPQGPAGDVTGIDTGSFATTGSNTFNGNQTINGYVSSSNAITAREFNGDGRNLNNLLGTTSWNYNQNYIVKKNEQLTFSGDYILEDCQLVIEGYQTASIGNWIPVNYNGNGTIARTSDTTYTIDGPNDGNGDGWLFIKKYFDTTTTMSIDYSWSNSDEPGHEWPIYEVSQQEPEEVDIVNRLDDINATTENGTWTINVPANRWVAVGVYSTDSSAGSGSLTVALPYEPDNDRVLYSANKSFKKEGTIYIGGNLLVKDSYIENNGKISVGGEVVLIGNSQIVGTGIII